MTHSGVVEGWPLRAHFFVMFISATKPVGSPQSARAGKGKPAPLDADLRATLHRALAAMGLPHAIVLPRAQAAELATLLGRRIDAEGLKQLHKRRKGPHHCRIGRRSEYRPEDVVRWIVEPS